MESTVGDKGWTNSNTTLAPGSQAVGERPQQPAEALQKTAARAQAATGQLADQAKEQLVSQLQTQKDRASNTLGTVAQTLRQTSQQLQDQGQTPIANYATKVAEGVERVTDYLNGREVQELRYDAERLARNQPVLFLAGAFALGWLGARFFKSGTPAQWSDQGAAGSTAFSSYADASPRGTQFGLNQPSASTGGTNTSPYRQTGIPSAPISSPTL